MINRGRKGRLPQKEAVSVSIAVAIGERKGVRVASGAIVYKGKVAFRSDPPLTLSIS